MPEKIKPFLSDTLWFGMTDRLSDDDLQNYLELRNKQGFDAIQVVVGVPPEVGYKNKNVSNKEGYPWDLEGHINRQYLEAVRERLQTINKAGFQAVVYGAWGHQIDWVGKEFMLEWWKKIVQYTNDLNVVYTLTGESDIWVGESKKLLPDKTSDEMHQSHTIIHPRIDYLFKKVYRKASQLTYNQKLKQRREDWSYVLENLSHITDHPILLHPLPDRTSNDTVSNPELLSAITIQTGHSEATRKLLWYVPQRIIKDNSESVFINLEPWYEGILGKFGTDDQLFSYWATMLSGASAYVYGAHGIWNIGDGDFLGHWGKQTFDQALELNTPFLIGSSHKLLLKNGIPVAPEEVLVEEDESVVIKSRTSTGKVITYVEKSTKDQKGAFFLPQTGEWSDSVKKGLMYVTFD